MAQEAKEFEVKGELSEKKGFLGEITPNRLTLLRIFLLPLPCALLFLEGYLAKLFSLGLGSLLGFTDYVDGVLARRHRKITTLGSMLDPIADKIFITVVYLTLVYLGYLPFAPVALLISRELIVAYLRSWFPEETKVVNLARWKTGLQMVIAGLAILLSLFDLKFLTYVHYALWCLAIFSYLSALPYFYRVKRALRRTQTEPLLFAKSLLSVGFSFALLLTFPLAGKLFFIIQVALSFYFFRKGLARTSPLHAQEESMLILGILLSLSLEALYRGEIFYSLFLVLAFSIYRDGLKSLRLIWEILKLK